MIESLDQVHFDETGLIPAIIQDITTGEVLTLAYMNRTALEKTLQTNETWFYSRSRQALWHKGETSGNTQTVKTITIDCDRDALLVQVEPQGPACHTGDVTCFHKPLRDDQTDQDTFAMIHELVATIKQRRENPVDGSYTTYLFREGIDKVLKKVGEETSEVIIGAKNNDHDELVWEICDLIYHTLVLMNIQDVSLTDLLHTLKKRHLTKEATQDD